MHCIFLADNDALNFIDNHDTQRSNSPLTYKSGGQYAMAVCFMLAWNYGYPRVMSSYYFSSSDQGPPSSGAPYYNVHTADIRAVKKQDSSLIYEYTVEIPYNPSELYEFLLPVSGGYM